MKIVITTGGTVGLSGTSYSKSDFLNVGWV